jgi:hypothetical protein
LAETKSRQDVTDATEAGEDKAAAEMPSAGQMMNSRQSATADAAEVLMSIIERLN